MADRCWAHANGIFYERVLLLLGRDNDYNYNESQWPGREGLLASPWGWEVPQERPSNPWLHFLLLLLTIITTTIAGAIMRIGGLFASPLPAYRYLFLHPWLIVEGLSFSIPLLSILGIHELGHYFACRYWNVRATLPYFIPVPYPPFLIGTAGAVIRIKSPIPNKRALLDIGAAGPIAGFVVAIIVSLVGLYMSEPMSTGTLNGGGIVFGDSLLFKGMVYLVFGKNQDVMLHPIAFAGWVGLLATFLNLLPIGQLDGGHITYALFQRGHWVIARIMTLFLIFLAVGGPLFHLGEFSLFWLLWAVLTFLLRKHPPPYDFFTPLDSRRKVFGYVCLAIFILCFVIKPFQLILPEPSTPHGTITGIVDRVVEVSNNGLSRMGWPGEPRDVWYSRGVSVGWNLVGR